MDSLTGFDDHEDFFASYDAEQASQPLSLAAIELDVPEGHAPSEEQLALAARFRKPVAWFMVAMTVLSLAALAKPNPDRELVAQYGAAIAATTPVAPAVTMPLTPAQAALPIPRSPESAAAATPAEPSAESRVTTSTESSAPAVSLPEPPPKPVSQVVVSHPRSASVSRSPLMSTLKPEATRVIAIAAPKPAALLPSGFTSVARFPDVAH